MASSARQTRTDLLNNAHRLSWAKQYILETATKLHQRKSIQNRTLDGIFAALNA